MKQNMKAVVAHSKDRYVLEELPIPELRDGDILIKVEACGICAGDIKAHDGISRFWGGDGMPPYAEPPFTPGHEFFGRIVAIQGEVPGNFAVGDRIISEQIVPCGECWYCKRRMYWLCDPHNVYGFKNYLNGGMAEYAILPRGSRNYHVPVSFTIQEAALIEPFACSLHGVQQGNITHTDTVVLAGAGTLGLGMVQAIRAFYLCRRLIVLDLMEHRLDLAKKYGADLVINPAKENALEKVLELTENVGCDVYIEATGHPSAVQQGLDLVRKGGTFVEFSVMSGPSTIDWSIIGDAKEITIRGSQLSPNCYPQVIDGFKNRRFSRRESSHISSPFRTLKKAYLTARSSESVKVILVP